MDNAAGAAGLLLKLYELRTEATLRQARAWFAFEFHPRTAQEILGTWLGPGHESAPFRMATSYWDMASSLVVQGAIPVDMFNAANTEHFAVYAKLRPFIAEVRATTRYPDFLAHLEHVATAGPDAEARLGVFERYMSRQGTLAAQGKQRPHFEPLSTRGSESADD
jgi:hypothetical protein